MTHVRHINLWPTLKSFADDIGVSYGTAKAIRRRGAIPACYWLAAVRGAEQRGLAGVTLTTLAEAVAQEPGAAGVHESMEAAQ